MKRSIILLVIPVFLFISCKKEESTTSQSPGDTNAQWAEIQNSNDTIRDMISTQKFIYAATKRNGLLRFDKTHQEITYFNSLNSGIPDDDLMSVAIDQDANLWIGSENSGLIRFDGNSWTTYTTNNAAIPSNMIRSIAVSGENIWLGTWNGLAKFDQTNWIIYDTLNSNIPDNRIRKVKISPAGTVWVGTQTAGLAKFENNDWIVFDDSNSGLVDNMIRTIEFDANGNLWTSSFLKFYSYDQNNWAAFDDSNTGISSKYVNGMGFGADGKKYFATHHGFSTLHNNEWEQFYDTNSTLHGNITEVVVIDNFNNKWIATYGGLAVYNETGVKF